MIDRQDTGAAVRRIVIAPSHLGYGLSGDAVGLLRERGHLDPHLLPRDDADLVDVVEHLGERAGEDIPWLRERVALAIIEIPADVEWTIEAYDGAEWVSERHRRWDYLGEVPPDGKPRYADE